MKWPKEISVDEYGRWFLRAYHDPACERIYQLVPKRRKKTARPTESTGKKARR